MFCTEAVEVNTSLKGAVDLTLSGPSVSPLLHRPVSSDWYSYYSGEIGDVHL